MICTLIQHQLILDGENVARKIHYLYETFKRSPDAVNSMIFMLNYNFSWKLYRIIPWKKSHSEHHILRWLNVFEMRSCNWRRKKKTPTHWIINYLVKELFMECSNAYWIATKWPHNKHKRPNQICPFVCEIRNRLCVRISQSTHF